MKPAGTPWKKYVRAGLGRRLSRLGERIGSHWLTYNPLHFQDFHLSAVENAPAVVSSILQVVSPIDSVLDVGAGSGAFAAEFTRRGVVAVAIEHSATGRKLAIKQGVDARPFDLMATPPAVLDRTFALAYCFEVAEHLPPPLAEKLVAFTAKASPMVIWTAAHPGQGGTGHINEQPREHWIALFQKYGHQHDVATSQALVAAFRQNNVPAAWFAQNAIVMRRA